jgi:hypothetical protein
MENSYVGIGRERVCAALLASQHTTMRLTDLLYIRQRVIRLNSTIAWNAFARRL